MATIRSNNGNSSSQGEIKPSFISPTLDAPPADLKVKLEAALESSERFLKLGLYSAALDECYEAISLLPTYLPLHVRIGEIYAASGRIDKAIEEYSVIASLCLVRDDRRGAVSVYRKIVELRPEDAGAAAKRLMGEQRWADAICLLEAMEQMNPEDDTIYARLAEAHFRQGNLNGSIRAFDRLAGVYSANGKRKRALGVFRVMKELAPGMTLPYLRLGDAYAEEEMAAEAAAEYEALADLQIKQGKAINAIATLKRVVQLDPGNSVAQARLDVIESSLGAQENEK